jgi:hypothetical protein
MEMDEETKNKPKEDEENIPRCCGGIKCVNGVCPICGDKVDED